MQINIRAYNTNDAEAILEIINFNILNSTSLYDYDVRDLEQQKNNSQPKYVVPKNTFSTKYYRNF